MLLRRLLQDRWPPEPYVPPSQPLQSHGRGLASRRHTDRVRAPKLPELRSPLARAVVPVAVGFLFIGLIGLALWGIAAAISGGNQQSGLLSNDTFTPGPAS